MLEKKPILYLILILILAHFLPFERVGLAPDDYAREWIVSNLSVLDIFTQAFREGSRPLSTLFISFYAKWIGIHPNLSFIILIGSTLLLNLSVYFLILRLVNEKTLALFISLFYLLLPNKLDMFQSQIYINMNLVFFLYVLSFIFFLDYVKKNTSIALGLSFFCYTLGIFWYEVGFFLPAIFFAYLLLYQRTDKIKGVLWFLLPILIYAAYRWTGLFGLIELDPTGKAINFASVPFNIFYMMPNHYIGRYMARAVLYGAYRFPSIEMPWLVILLVLDSLIIYVFARWIKNAHFSKIPAKILWISGISFFLFLTPNFFYLIEGRHTVLASIGFVILMGALVLKFGFLKRWIIVGLFVICLIVSQGTAWNQVVAARLNATFLKHIQETKDVILKSEKVLIDQYSFARHIPYTWGEKVKNQLDNFWGMQAFAPWGLSSMVWIGTDYEYRPKEKRRIFVCISGIEQKDQSYLCREKFSPQVITFPKEGTHIIDYDLVYQSGFVNGWRKEDIKP